MYRKSRNKLALSIAFSLVLSLAFGQESQPSLPENANLQDVIHYALENRPSVHQALIDEEVGDEEIASALSGWFPQINATGTYNWNVKIPTSVIGGNVIQLGQKHVSAAVLQADQQILNPGLMQASKAARFIRQQNALNTESSRINTVVEVSKAYYDILTSEEQLNIIKENIERIQRQLNDAKARYETGIVDKTDFKRAQITLSNTLAEQKRVSELLTYKYAFLKELIGLSADQPMNLSFDNAAMESEILLDTTLTVDYNERVEFRQLQTVKQLQHLNTQ
ncbi:MAG: TolC family protein, partial [Parapedobacter sp.]